MCWRAQEWQLSHFTPEKQTNRDKFLIRHYTRARLWDGLLMRDYNTRLQFSLHSHCCCQHLSTHPVGWPWYPISLTWLRGKKWWQKEKLELHRRKWHHRMGQSRHVRLHWHDVVTILRGYSVKSMSNKNDIFHDQLSHLNEPNLKINLSLLLMWPFLLTETVPHQRNHCHYPEYNMAEHVTVHSVHQP